MALLFVVSALGCQRQIRFDEPVPGAGVDGSPDPSTDDAATGSARDAATDRPVTSDGALPADAVSSSDTASSPDTTSSSDARRDGAPADVPLAPDVAADVASSPDLAVDRALTPDRPPPDMAPPGCPGLCSPWSPQCQTGIGCDSDCDNGATCTGSCGINCGARCRGTSDCTVSAADNADLECREGSNCGFVLASGNVRCRESAECNVHCLGPCNLTCEGATCTLRCASDPAPHSANSGGRCN
jgi:hypothetical protein